MKALMRVLPLLLVLDVLGGGHAATAAPPPGCTAATASPSSYGNPGIPTCTYIATGPGAFVGASYPQFKIRVFRNGAWLTLFYGYAGAGPLVTQAGESVEVSIPFAPGLNVRAGLVTAYNQPENAPAGCTVSEIWSPSYHPTAGKFFCTYTATRPGAFVGASFPGFEIRVYRNGGWLEQFHGPAGTGPLATQAGDIVEVWMECGGAMAGSVTAYDVPQT